MKEPQLIFEQCLSLHNEIVSMIEYNQYEGGDLRPKSRNLYDLKGRKVFETSYQVLIIDYM